jgi:uncharacterized protein
MACDYCYYRKVGDLYEGNPARRMSLRVFDELCRQYRALEPAELKFGWQGGEPTLMGLEFFQQVINIERKHSRPAERWGNSIQTNGVVLDDGWCDFFKRQGFLVGLSLDGPAGLNQMRKFPNGRQTHDMAMRAVNLLQKHGCDFNILVVISTANVDQPEAVFRLLVENELHFSQFIPCTEPAPGGAGLSEHSITGEQYAEFMTRLFNAWVDNDDPGYYVRHIDNWLHLFLGLEPECCEYRRDCSDLITVEWNGDVYPCDFFVEDRCRLGNVLEQTLSQALSSSVWKDFVRKAEQYPAPCHGCEWLRACHGGCYRHRERLGIGPDEKPYLCDANKKIFSHVFETFEDLRSSPIRPRLHKFLNELTSRVQAAGLQGAEAVRPARTEQHGIRSSNGGRNAACPCGSGKKWKYCCMKRSEAGHASSTASLTKAVAQEVKRAE